MQPGKDLHYTNLNQRPFEGGTVWLQLLGRSPGYRNLLFDLESGAVLGELVGGGPEQFNRDQTLLLCGQRTTAHSSPVVTGLQNLANAVGSVWRMVGQTPPGLPRTSRPAVSLDQEDYWALDLRTGEATYLGQIMERGRIVPAEL